MFSTEARKKFWLFVVGALTFLLAAATLNSIFVTARLADQIQSCTTPAGACHKQQMKTTGGVAQGINLTTVYTAVCVLDGVRGDKALLRCVERRVKAYVRTSP